MGIALSAKGCSRHLRSVRRRTSTGLRSVAAYVHLGGNGICSLPSRCASRRRSLQSPGGVTPALCRRCCKHGARMTSPERAADLPTLIGSSEQTVIRLRARHHRTIVCDYRFTAEDSQSSSQRARTSSGRERLAKPRRGPRSHVVSRRLQVEGLTMRSAGSGASLAPCGTRCS